MIMDWISAVKQDFYNEVAESDASYHIISAELSTSG